MRIDEIKRSALENFVVKSYEATTLDDIVKTIGIKKQSIYSHFKNKEAIFLSVMTSVLTKEIAFINDFFSSQDEQSLDRTLYALLLKYRNRYLLQDDAELKFLLRMAFMPPFDLQEETITQFHLYNDALEKALLSLFSSYHLPEQVAQEGMLSFQHFLDGLLVELIYSGSSIDRIDKRLGISWTIYWEGFSKRIQEN